MKIRDLDLNQYVIVYDMGKSENSAGMTVVGRVVDLIFNEYDDNEARIVSLGCLYKVTDSNYFDLWSNYIESKTESIRKARRPSNASKWIEKAIEDSEEYINKVKSNDLQQRKRNAPSHYEGEVDFLDYFFMQATPDEMRGAMKFTMGRYATRLGRKDDEVKELDKIIDYSQRYKEKLTE
ncbi:DUF3310 domain-containing protein [Staphylococcus xylosus]|uniref:DUF3310 domain-containing protein n=1 Tax=Staphylococcus xylosus TaxID=1288 RepID=UPI002DB6D600|nr:DUF3310 domain-containing protein [Staphylococcus xylosus]MEB8101031.1 DUF3310 domain-containing protein [Staphylococcus xylosus]